MNLSSSLNKLHSEEVNLDILPSGRARQALEAYLAQSQKRARARRIDLEGLEAAVGDAERQLGDLLPKSKWDGARYLHCPFRASGKDWSEVGSAVLIERHGHKWVLVTLDRIQLRHNRCIEELYIPKTITAKDLLEHRKVFQG